MKPFRGWKPKKSDAPETEQISAFIIDAHALKHSVNDTVVEVRGAFTDYRAGDILQSIRGARFIR